MRETTYPRPDSLLNQIPVMALEGESIRRACKSQSVSGNAGPRHQSGYLSKEKKKGKKKEMFLVLKMRQCEVGGSISISGPGRWRPSGSSSVQTTGEDTAKGRLPTPMRIKRCYRKGQDPLHSRAVPLKEKPKREITMFRKMVRK